MTTIIATKSCMYSDSQVSGGPLFKTEKIFRCGDSILGMAGDVVDCLMFIDWFKAGKKKKRKESGCEDTFYVLELNRDGIYLWDYKYVPMTILDQYYAIGSGSATALGALAHGATPQEAIKIAARYDSYTNTVIKTVPLLEGSNGEANPIRKQGKAKS